jgi:hypothetical protein
MRSAIPEFSRLVSPLKTILERVYVCGGARTRASAQRALFRREAEHHAAYAARKQLLINS